MLKRTAASPCPFESIVATTLESGNGDRGLGLRFRVYLFKSLGCRAWAERALAHPPELANPRSKLRIEPSLAGFRATDIHTYIPIPMFLLVMRRQLEIHETNPEQKVGIAHRNASCLRFEGFRLEG